MILDRLALWSNYFKAPVWREAFGALEQVTADIADGDHPIRGTDIVLKVGGGPTFEPATREFEAHREFIDIQMMLSGTERMDWAPLAGLSVTKPYRQDSDVAFFNAEGNVTQLQMVPGLFVVFFPEDAHRPGLHPAGEPVTVRKTVIKLRRSLVTD